MNGYSKGLLSLVLVVVLFAGLPCMAGDAPVETFTSPHEGVLCNVGEGACYDDHGPSLGLTAEYLGKEAADALLERLRQAPAPGNVLNVFRVGPGRFCVQQLAVCMRNGHPDEALQESLFGAADTPQAFRSILNRKWQWVETLMNNDERFAPDDPARFTVEFMDGGALALLADCNGGGGTYHYRDGRLSYEGLFTTMMHCGEDSLDHVFLKQLQETEQVFLKDGELYLLLRYDSGAMRFREAPRD